jgi:CP family cyanate transporter-like MFS transporter
MRAAGMDPAARPRYAFLLAAWAVNVCINAFYIVPTAVFPEMSADLGISKAQGGSLISIYLVAIMLFQISGGYASDRVDPRKTIVLASLVLLGLSGLMAVVPRYDVLLALRFAAGIPVAFIFAPSAFLVSRAFADRPGRAVGLFLSAPPAGVAIGNLLSPVIAANGGLGWPFAFVAFHLPLLALLPLFAMTAAKIPPRVHAPFALADYLRAFRSHELWKVGLVFASSYAAYIFYSGWTRTYVEEAGLLAGASVAILSMLIPAAGIVSRPLGGHLAESRFRRDKRWVPGLSFGLLIVASLAIPPLGGFGLPVLVLGGFLAQFPFSVYYLFSSQILPERFAGTAYAFMNAISIVGGAISPALAGYLADVTGSFAAAFVMIAATAVIGLGLLAAVRER